MTNSGPFYSLDLILRPHHPESQRKPGHHLLSYRWIDVTHEDDYDGPFPIKTQKNDQFSFKILDYTKSLEEPTLKVDFKPLQGNVAHSPVDEATTRRLQNGVASIGHVEAADCTVFEFAALTLTNAGTGFEFSVDIDDPSNPQDKWFVDPQMIVEGEG